MTLRVCLIDDDHFVRDALALGLSDAGYQVVTAPGAAAGLDLISRHPVDAIITDLNMPGTGGSELISEVRQRWPDLPIVAISGAASIDGKALPDLARELGANAALTKPFRARQLADTLQQVMSARGASN